MPHHVINFAAAGPIDPAGLDALVGNWNLRYTIMADATVSAAILSQPNLTPHHVINFAAAGQISPAGLIAFNNNPCSEMILQNTEAALALAPHTSAARRPSGSPQTKSFDKVNHSKEKGGRGGGDSDSD